MKDRSKLVIAGISAGVLMALVVNSASANRLSIGHGSLWRSFFRAADIIAGGVTGIECEMTFEGSFHSATIKKVERALIGHITRASVGTCPVGSATVLSGSLPWHVQYAGFVGRLPEITGVSFTFIGVSFRLKEGIFLRECLLRTSEVEPTGGIAELAAGTEARTINGLRLNETLDIPCRNGSESILVSLRGTGTVTELPGGARNVFIKLI